MAQKPVLTQTQGRRLSCINDKASAPAHDSLCFPFCINARLSQCLVCLLLSVVWPVDRWSPGNRSHQFKCTLRHCANLTDQMAVVCQLYLLTHRLLLNHLIIHDILEWNGREGFDECLCKISMICKDSSGLSFYTHCIPSFPSHSKHWTVLGGDVEVK